MKRLIIFLILMSLPLVSCESDSESILFHDDFDGVLSDDWELIREVPTQWSLSEKPGFLRIVLDWGSLITTVDGVVRSDAKPPNNILLLRREFTDEDFEITTYVEFEPTRNYQLAGLIVYKDDTNGVVFGRAFCDTPPPACSNNSIYHDNVINGEFGENYAYSNANKVVSEIKAHLRVRREGTTYTGYYSEDGENWIEIGSHTNDFNSSPLRVGLMTGQDEQPGNTTADFDYFTVKELPD